MTDRQTDRPTARQTQIDRQPDRQTQIDRQTDTDRQTARQTQIDRQTDTGVETIDDMVVFCFIQFSVFCMIMGDRADSLTPQKFTQ